MYEFSAETLACHLMRVVDTPRIVYYRESRVPHSLYRGVTDDIGESFLTILKDSTCL
jgi:hypothetical protein